MTPETYRTNGTLIDVESVSLELGGNLILRDLDIKIEDLVRPGRIQGQIVGFLGPSGIGKTQFSRVLTGLQKPTTGHVHIHDDDRIIEVARGLVGMVMQEYPLFEDMSVMANLMLVARRKIKNAKEAREKCLWFLERFKLADRANVWPGQLSGGQRQRVAIAQQLLCSEHYIVMDEPFSGLDPLMKSEVEMVISETASFHEKNTIIVITHDIRAALAISDHLWVMGRDHNADGSSIPGARIVSDHNLIDRGLAWHPDIRMTQEFGAFVMEIEEQFRTLL